MSRATGGLGSATLRVARPTDDLERAVAFYRDGLGMEELGRFEDHDGFDGVMLGFGGAPWHLELTHHRGTTVGRAPTRDNLLVFYVPDEEAWRSVRGRIEGHGYAAVASDNPYWDAAGVTFEDPDGYRVVIQRARWEG